MKRLWFAILGFFFFALLALTLGQRPVIAQQSTTPSPTPKPKATPIPSNKLAPSGIQSLSAPTAGCDNSQCVFPVLVGGDDAGITPSDCLYHIDADQIYFGQCYNGQSITSGFRFPNVTLTAAQASQISQAYLEFLTDGPYENMLNLALYGEATGNSQSFSTSSRSDNRKLTQAFASWNISTMWDFGEVHQSADVTAILQEILRRNDWKPGNALANIAKNVEPTVAGQCGITIGFVCKDRRVVSYEVSKIDLSMPPPKLVIKFGANNWTMVLSLKPTLKRIQVNDAVYYRIHLFHARTSGTSVVRGAEIALAQSVLPATGYCDSSSQTCSYKLTQELTELPNLVSRTTIDQAGYFWYVDALASDQTTLIATGAQATFQIPPLGLWSEDCTAMGNKCPVTNNLEWNKYDDLYYRWAEQRNLPPALVKAVSAHESGGLRPIRNGLPASRAYLYEPAWDYRSFALSCVTGVALPSPWNTYVNQDLCHLQSIRPYTQTATLGSSPRNSSGTTIYPKDVASVSGRTWESVPPPTIPDVAADRFNIGTKTQAAFAGIALTNRTSLADMMGVRFWSNPSQNQEDSTYNDLVAWFGNTTSLAPPLPLVNSPNATTNHAPFAQYRIMASFGLGQITYWNHFNRPMMQLYGSPRPPEDLYDPDLSLNVSTAKLSENRGALDARSITTVVTFTVTSREYSQWGEVRFDKSGNPIYNYRGDYPNLYNQFNQWSLALGAYNGLGQNLQTAESYVRYVRPYFALTQPRNLAPTIPSDVQTAPAIAAATASLQTPSEIVVASRLVDIRGDSNPALMVLTWRGSLRTGADGSGITRIFSDPAGKNLALEIETQQRVAPFPSLWVLQQPGTHKRFLQVEWGVGVHSVVTQLTEWTATPTEACRSI